jgi:hypothetical protein
VQAQKKGPAERQATDHRPPQTWAGPNQKGRYQEFFARVGMHYRNAVSGGEPWLRTPLLCIPLVHEPINKSECRA